jgi:hypothetical protein
MKKVIGLGLLLTAVSTGCMGWQGFKTPEPPAAPPPARRAAPPITVDQVNPNNAHQIADELESELGKDQK